MRSAAWPELDAHYWSTPMVVGMGLDRRPTSRSGWRPGQEAGRSGGDGTPRSVEATPTSADISRSSGRLIPTTLWWSPSMPRHERAAEPVDGERPGDLSGSPVATYASISASVTSAKCTRGGGRRPTTARPGRDDAVAGVQHAGAAAHRLPARGGLVGVRGLAEASPSRASTESQPITSACRRDVVRAATAGALSAASSSASRRAVAVELDSSTPDTITRGRARPGAAWRAGRGRPKRGRGRSRRHPSVGGVAATC